jgi:hypothetical protein
LWFEFDQADVAPDCAVYFGTFLQFCEYLYWTHIDQLFGDIVWFGGLRTFQKTKQDYRVAGDS